MNNEHFYTQLEKLNQEYHRRRNTHESYEPVLFAIKELINSRLRVEPINTELWLRLAMLESMPPWEWPEKIIACVEKILEYDPYNIDAHLVRCYYSYMLTPDMEKIYFEEIINIKPNNLERSAMIEIIKDYYYSQENNEKLAEKALLQAIEYCPYFAKPYLSLGEFYVRRRRVKEAKPMFEIGLKNITHIYNNDCYDITDLEQFYDEAFRETHVSPLRLDMALDLAKRVGVDISA